MNPRPHGPANVGDDAEPDKLSKPAKPDFTYDDLLAQTPYEYDDQDDSIQSRDWPQP